MPVPEIIRTPRLVLRPPEVTDVPAIVALANDPYMARMTLNIPHPYREEDAEFWINLAASGRETGDKFVYAIHDGHTDVFMGGVGLHVEAAHRRGVLGYWIGAPFRRRGYTTEAAAALVEAGFVTLGLNRIEATHVVGNAASGRVMVKNGMRHEGTLRDYFVKAGAARTVELYAVLAADVRPSLRE